MAQPEEFRVLTSSENAPFMVGLIGIGYVADVGVISALRHNRHEAQTQTYDLQTRDSFLQAELSNASKAPPAIRAAAQSFLKSEIKQNQQGISVADNLPWAPNTLESIGIGISLPLIGAAALTAVSSSVRYLRYRNQKRSEHVAAADRNL